MNLKDILIEYGYDFDEKIDYQVNNSKGFNYVSASDFFQQKDVDIFNKLVNLHDAGQIDDNVFEMCMNADYVCRASNIEARIIEMLSTKDSGFDNLLDYLDLIDGYEGIDLHDTLTAGLYNNDLLYMQAIAYVLDLDIPQNASECLCYDAEVYLEHDL